MTTEREQIISIAQSQLQATGVENGDILNIINGDYTTGNDFIDALRQLGRRLSSNKGYETIDQTASAMAVRLKLNTEIANVIFETNQTLEENNLPLLSESEIIGLEQLAHEAFYNQFDEYSADLSVLNDPRPLKVIVLDNTEFLINTVEDLDEAMAALLTVGSGNSIVLKFDASDAHEGYFLVHRYQYVPHIDGVKVNVFETVEASDGSPAPDHVTEDIIGSERVWQFILDDSDLQAQVIIEGDWEGDFADLGDVNVDIASFQTLEAIQELSADQVQLTAAVSGTKTLDFAAIGPVEGDEEGVNSSGVEVDLSTGQLNSLGSAEIVNFSGFTSVLGTGFVDEFTLSTKAEIVIGGGGNDVFNIVKNADGEGPDIIWGGADNDTYHRQCQSKTA